MCKRNKIKSFFRDEEKIDSFLKVTEDIVFVEREFDVLPLLKIILSEEEIRFQYLKFSNRSSVCDRLVNQINELADLYFKVVHIESDYDLQRLVDDLIYIREKFII